jgi:hypothetical protein
MEGISSAASGAGSSAGIPVREPHDAAAPRASDVAATIGIPRRTRLAENGLKAQSWGAQVETPAPTMASGFVATCVMVFAMGSNLLTIVSSPGPIAVNV